MLQFGQIFQSYNPINGLLKGENIMDYFISYGLNKEILNLVNSTH